MGTGKEKKSKDKSKKHKKDKKRSSDKRRRRDSSDSDSSSSESDRDDRKRAKSQKLANKVVQHLEKVGAATGTAAPFVWTKKVEKELQSGKKLKEVSIFTDANRQAERMEELEKVRKRQAEREAEKAQREEELTMVQRMRAAQEALESEAKEEEFYLKAMVEKALRRLQEGRPEPIDLISKNLHLVEQFEFELEDPWKYFSGLLYEDMQRVADEIREFKEYDKYDELHGQFWEALHVISQQELNEARKRDEADRALIRANRAAASGMAGASTGAEELQQAPQERGLHPDVEEDIENMLHGQTLGQLITLEESVDQALQSGDGDPEYWEAVHKRLKIHKAKAQVRDIMSKLFGRAIKKMRAATAETAAKAGEDGAQEAGARASSEEPLLPSEDDKEWQELEEEARRVRDGSQPPGEGAGPGTEAGEEDEGRPGPSRAAAGGVAARRAGSEPPESDDEEMESDGRYSPPPVDRLLVQGQDIIHEDDDAQQIELLRQQVLLQEAQRFKAASTTMGSISGPGYGTGIGADNEMRMVRATNRAVHPMFRNLAAQAGDAGFRTGREGTEIEGNNDTLQSFRNQSLKLMGPDEGDREFGGEVPLESTVYWWHEKYKPRKPKYFNRVHTGYEWNKYNQTHYDSDNPPPKVVQGYKFNILYHDLIDKSKAPEYRIEPDPDSTDNSTCMLRFIAGPPYEDIAFRIVNKEWEYSHKRGFRCTFERGILHLYFNFMRTRYRR